MWGKMLNRGITFPLRRDKNHRKKKEWPGADKIPKLRKFFQ
jgi:hypothetical protein